MSTSVANGVEPEGRLVAGGSKRVNKLELNKYRALSLEFMTLLQCFHLEVIEYLCRGRRAVPLQTFTTRHSIRKLSIVMVLSTTFTQFAP